MRIVLSRKGFDSGYGGVPSPVFEDGTMLSLPIPDPTCRRRFGQLAGGSMPSLVADLTKGRLRHFDGMHMDPDIDAKAFDRGDGWRGSLGQTGAAQRHLENERVGPGDIFLFFGWFAHVENTAAGWRRVPGKRDFHSIFGWLLVEEVVSLADGGTAALAARPWLSGHPHVGRSHDPMNTLYVASEHAPMLGKGISGSGVLPRFDEKSMLTDMRQPSKSVWRVPSFFSAMDRNGLSYHRDRSRWADEGDTHVLRSVARGQEFVIDVGDSPDALSWLRKLISR